MKSSAMSLSRESFPLILLASILALAGFGCSSPTAEPAAAASTIPAAQEQTRSNPNCLTPDQERSARTEPVSNEAAMRLERHFGGCIKDSEKALPWMRLAAEREDPEAMLGLAAMLEGGEGPAAAVEVNALRKRAAELKSGQSPKQ
jgi:TPR repeat protein